MEDLDARPGGQPGPDGPLSAVDWRRLFVLLDERAALAGEAPRERWLTELCAHEPRLGAALRVLLERDRVAAARRFLTLTPSFVSVACLPRA